MKRPSSTAQLALIDLPAPTDASPRKARRGSSWRQVQAANNARQSEELLARLAARPAPAPTEIAPRPHAADRPHPPAAEPSVALDWRAEELARLFEAVERASRGGHLRRTG